MALASDVLPTVMNMLLLALYWDRIDRNMKADLAVIVERTS